jgi:hypothetical protein
VNLGRCQDVWSDLHPHAPEGHGAFHILAFFTFFFSLPNKGYSIDLWLLYTWGSFLSGFVCVYTISSVHFYHMVLWVFWLHVCMVVLALVMDLVDMDS